MTPRMPLEQLGFARELRREMTTAEAMLWRGLRGRGVNAKFRRQMPIGIYVADFACVEAKLIVEIDGPAHAGAERQRRDEYRDAWLANRAGASCGLRMPR
jgi:very-short-patch-repair endonuclease